MEVFLEFAHPSCNDAVDAISVEALSRLLNSSISLESIFIDDHNLQ